MLLVGLFAAGLWGSMVRPAAYEVRGEIVARPARDTILVRHEALGALGMGAMEMMAVRGDPGLLDAHGVGAGQRVRLTVRAQGEELVLLRIDRLP